MTTIKIKNLKLKAIIGIHAWERRRKQEVVINALIDFDGSRAVKSDRISDTLDYKKITKQIIVFAQKSRFFLLEALTESVLTLIMKDKRVTRALVEIDKPFALRFADSVSVTREAKRPHNLAVVGVGSNIQPKRHVKHAERLIDQEHRILKVSSFVKTRPIGAGAVGLTKEFYLNGAFLVETSSGQSQFKQQLKKIETVLGRKRMRNKHAPRQIDLDIVVWNGRVVNRDFDERDFVRKAVLELIPDLQSVSII